MKIFCLLVKRQFLEVFTFNKIFQGKAKEKRTYLSIFWVVLSGACILAAYWFSNIYQIALQFQSSQDILDYLIKPLSLISMLVIFLSSLMRGSGILYADKNMDIFFAYPIKTRDIVLSKLCFIYVWGFLIAFMMLIVPVFRYEILERHILFGISDLFWFLLLPVIPVLSGVILGYVLYKYMGRAFQSEFYLRSLLYLVLLFSFIAFMLFFLQDIDFNNLYKKMLIESGCLNMLMKGPFFAHSPEAVKSTIIFLVIGSSLTYYILKSYKSRCYQIQMPDIRKKAAKQKYKKKTRLYSLFLRELRRYFSTPVYVMNTMLGIIGLILFTIYSCLNTENVLMYMGLIGDVFEVKSTSAICACMVSLLITLTNVTYASISIEGRNHEVVKAFPISFKEIIAVKYLFHLSLTVPVLCIADLFLGIVFEMNPAEWFLWLVLPMAFTAFAGRLGLLMNLLFPDYEWENITYIVKQSIPAVFTVLFSLSAGGLSFWAIMYLFNNSVIAAFYILAGIFLLLSFGIGVSVKGLGKNKL